MYSIRIFVRKVFKLPCLSPPYFANCYCEKAQPSPPPPPSEFQLQRALVVSKLSRYEYERQRHKDLSEEELEQVLRKRGSNFDLLLHHHQLHKDFEGKVAQTLEQRGIETRVVNRFTYNEKLVQWANIVFAAGGDGTFLLAASRIRDNQTPIIGLNSDPMRSEGHLCLPKGCSSDIEGTVDKLKRGQFRWSRRSRIRITICGERMPHPPTELHEQDLLESCQMYFANYQINEVEQSALAEAPLRCLPILALNEVFLSESFSARVSYFELALDGGTTTSVKCSGLCVASGTGSTSWHLSINRLTQQNMMTILRLLREEGVEAPDASICDRIADKFNDELVFAPDDTRLCYTIRDHISADVWPNPKGILPRGFVNKIEVKSRCFDGALVVDGTVSFGFNDGTCALLETYPEDSLLTVTLELD